VRGVQVRKSASPTISTSVYAAGDAIGGLLEWTDAVRVSGGSAILQSVTIVDKDSERAAMDLVLFDATFTAPTDNAAFDPTDAELAGVVGVVPIYSGDYSAFSDNAVAHRSGLGMPLVLAGTSLFGALVARSTPTYTATTDLSVILGILQD